MNASVAVQIHPSRFPHAVAAAMRDSLRTRRMHHAFHYDTPKQTLRWLRVHETFSPARLDATCHAAYAQAAAAAVAHLANAAGVEVIGLGCGGGQKEAQLLASLRVALPHRALHYVPADVSVGLTLIARAAALATGLTPAQCAPLVLDLAATTDWRMALASVSSGRTRRLVTFFGLLPNFTPAEVLPQLHDLLAPDDLLLLSANLAPGPDYAAGVAQAGPLYDNEPTRAWLLTVLLDLGVEHDDGHLEFGVAACPADSGLLRIEAQFQFTRARSVTFEGEEFYFTAGERFQLFYSYRHTVARVTARLWECGITVTGSWANAAGDEGVFLGRRGPEPRTH